MSIEISWEKCVGCGSCAQICPGSLIRLEGQKAVIARPQRCWGCASCVKECPVQAISMYLGEDMGGRGGRLTVRREGKLLHWTVSLPDGGQKTITVDGSQSNRY
ncbi:MAG: ferredoxin family protein [Clostridium sp.]|nr:ferredoxin family protein [Clostridium sp.]